MLSFNRVSLLCLTALLALGQSQDPQSSLPVTDAPPEPVTVIAVRHAEKGTADPRDPVLTPEGQARAKDLARLLAVAGVTHLYSTDYQRTRQTLAPLAEALKLDVASYSPRDLEAFAIQLAQLSPGSVAVVSGHSNTTPGLVQALGGQIEGIEVKRGTPMLGDGEYDRLFLTVLTPPCEQLAPGAKTVELRYGQASEPK